MGKRRTPASQEPSKDKEKEPLKPVEEAPKCAPGSKWPNMNLAKTALWASVGGGFNFGYQLVITNPAQEAFLQFLNDSYAAHHVTRLERTELENIWGIIVSSLFWGATAGALMIQAVSDRLGRKYGIIVTFSLQVLSMFLAMASHWMESYIIYTASRIILGIALSISIGIGPLFIMECSPVSCRGVISMSTGMMLQCGLVGGAITAMPEVFGTYEKWWLIYALEAVATLIVTILLFFSPESPSFLMTQGKREEAQKSVIYYHGVSEADAQPLLAAMQTTTDKTGQAEKPVGLFGIFVDKEWICGFWIGIGIMAGAIWCGVAAVNAFAFEILLNVGLSVLEASIGNLFICIMAVVGVLASSRVIENVGRRPMLIYTFAGLAIVNTFIAGFMMWFEKSRIGVIGWCVVISCCIFNLIFAAGPGPLCLFVGGELVGARAKAATFTWMNIAMNGLRVIILVLYFPLKNLLGPPISFWIMFFPPCALAVLLCFFYLPETTGKTPEEAKEAMQHLPRLCGGMEPADPELVVEEGTLD
ncbi:unnamed protein product [Cylicocyclus nassatus]|uniref:Major facilitator superfamily (MFS) profile domain-containing protein n=1 Tax=Cylicocyclus nassatus TaxID=53992 RepID=A0AA36GZX0_CYLNA|nr:unnamed protein product [Cylicocyclus nassatus]